jgi:hypothetical protein
LIQGRILDNNDVTVIHAWFNEIGITPATEVGFNLAAGAAVATGTIRPQCNAIIRVMMRAAKDA